MTHHGKSSPSPLLCVQIPTAHYSDYDWTIYREKEAFNKTAVSRVSVGVAEHRLYGVAPKRHPPGELMSGVSGGLSNTPKPRRNLPVTSICCIWAAVPVQKEISRFHVSVTLQTGCEIE